MSAPQAEAVDRPVGRAPAISRRALVAVGLALVVGAAGVAWILAPRASETTEAAYVQADSSVIAPRIRVLVAEVLVAHNQAVRKGDPLVRVDPEEFDARVAAARADLVSAEAGVAAARAALAALDADTLLAASNIRAAEAAVPAADAQDRRADADRQRFETLAPTGAVARRDVDAYGAAAVAARSETVRARALLEASRNQAGVVAARRAVLEAAQAQADGALARARAALALALQDQSHTVIRAPFDGVVADRQVEPGDYVQPGTRLLSIEPLGRLYVTANFKETQTPRMAPGQAVRLKVDALPGQVLSGRVESLAPGTG